MWRNLIHGGVLCAAAMCVIGCDPPSERSTEPDGDLLVDAACGQCQLGLEGGGCDLAVRIEGVAYFVDGTAIDDHGDAHGEDGFCNTVRQARVRGRVEDERFAATSFEVLPYQGE